MASEQIINASSGAYTPINWQTGDTITAEKMNKMDNGWGYESTQLFSETVTTASQDGMVMGTLTYGSQIDAFTLTVTFDGTDYTCNGTGMGERYAYGGIGSTGPDFTDYPFALISAVNAGGGNMIYTETAGSHAVAATGEALAVSSAFRAAVRTAGALVRCISGETTYDEMNNARASGTPMYFYDGNGRCFFVTDMDASPIGISPDTGDLTPRFDENDVFTITSPK